MVFKGIDISFFRGGGERGKPSGAARSKGHGRVPLIFFGGGGGPLRESTGKTWAPCLAFGLRGQHIRGGPRVRPCNPLLQTWLMGACLCLRLSTLFCSWFKGKRSRNKTPYIETSPCSIVRVAACWFLIRAQGCSIPLPLTYPPGMNAICFHLAACGCPFVEAQCPCLNFARGLYLLGRGGV